MIHEAHGNILAADTEALVNTVNTQGVMGKGIALQFKRAYPAMFKQYAKASKAGAAVLGRMWVWTNPAFEGARVIINFPTKQHWRSRSRLTDIDAGLTDLVKVIGEMNIASIAVPPLGCGNGGLDWRDVRPLIELRLGELHDVAVFLYPPEGAPAASDMATGGVRPEMTRGKAALVEMLRRYSDRTLDVSIVEAQKLMYLLQESGEPLRLDFLKQRYGPYAHNLNHVLRTVEGHFLTGYGDGSKKVRETEPSRSCPGRPRGRLRPSSGHLGWMLASSECST